MDKETENKEMQQTKNNSLRLENRFIQYYKDRTPPSPKIKLLDYLRSQLNLHHKLRTRHIQKNKAIRQTGIQTGLE
jgi:hypothetical protein